MIPLKFRAVVPERNATIYFTLDDLIGEYIKFSIREILIPWLEAGNTPDLFTGLTDKNKRDIYEGDILLDSESVKWIVFYDNEIGRFRLVAPNNKDWIEDVTEFMLFGPTTSEDGDVNLKIIGNIYENPELLEECE